MAGSLIFEFQLELPEHDAEPVAPGQPMRLLVLGDFSGRAPDTPLARRPIHRLDLDHFDQVMARCAPALDLTLDGAPATVRFTCLDDFHPDQLYQQAETFQPLRNQRQRLSCPTSFAAAAAQMQAPTTPAPSPAPAPAQADGGDFASLLGGAVRPAAPRSDIDALVKALVGAVPGTDTRQSSYLAAADSVIGARMRELLHTPAFQRLEAAWRSVHKLVTELELDSGLELYLVDISKDELAADLKSAGAQLQQSALYQLLVERPRQSPDGAPWSILVGDYRFDAGEEDVQSLSALAALASQAGAPLLAGAHDSVLGCAQLASTPDPDDWTAPEAAASERWQALRASPHAGWLALAVPRMLLRLPYGKLTDRIDHFNFEEADGQLDHDHYLWGNAAFGLALLLGQAFNAEGWDMDPGGQLELDDLPAHTFRRDGEAHMQACAETWLSDRAAEAVLRLGLMPLRSLRDRNAARFQRCQSLAQPPQALCGPWQR
ncbi:type VI secretion system contractile sheath large subunit [Duganella sp. LX20W]|uniref:Type VI secretion system contractile sheath large subunit n=1 Tax=Rugamonas brunnea TaxID=2758569 RepID=A0A7W2ETQ3_9BURK|nr:type VI secretion system contractile sheath large subunit [Rugamonas brunnea]MBA5638463.1 type VI secretion system contractile sheath large subunit [Rugamonas brunnea]